jgi:hypothetical protein
MSRKFSALAVCLLLVCAGGQRALVSQTPAVSLDLTAIFELGLILQDRNGDNVIDFVNARLVLGEQPDASDVAAAANVAARLGYETSAMTLPLSQATSGVPIVIGAAGLQRAGVAASSVGVTPAAGEGVVSIATLGGQPAIVIAGADAAGTRAASEALAGRIPKDPHGTTLIQVRDDLRAALSEHGVVDIRIPEVRATTANSLDVVADVTLGTAANVAAAQKTLSALRPAKQAAAPAAGSASASRLSYPGIRIVRARLTAEGAKPVVADVGREAEPEPAPIGRRPGSGAKDNLDLSSLFSNDGLVGDSDSNLIPDRIDAVLSPHGDGVVRTVDLAARLGLESTGVSIPIALPADAVRTPASEATLVLIGTAHPIVEQLVKDGKFQRPTLAAGEGLIQVVKKAFGDKSAIVITGADARGVDAALRQAAERWPHIHERGKDRTTVDDVEEDLRRALAGRSPVGQAATALYKLERIGRQLSGRTLAEAEVRIHVEKPPDEFAAFARTAAASLIKASKVDVMVENLDVQKARPVINEEFAVASEVDDFWRALRGKVVSGVRRGQPVTVEARLSEPPEVRQRIAREATDELIRAGASREGTNVVVLSAYKQGYSWLYDVVRPAIAGKPIDRLTIRFAEIGPPPEWRQQAMFAPTRWLLEIFPIDEVLARDLKIDLAKIAFEKMPIGSPAYEAIATDTAGQTLFRGTFEPAVVVRPCFDRFPDYERVRVTTGWIRARSGERTLADERIVTDPERFWDHFQGKTLPAIYDYVMALTEGKPRAEDAPHFGELTVDLTLSEPEYRLGIDKEQIASMEAMHEEIYFSTLHFFDVLGRYTRGAALNYPGRVIPIVRPKADGAAGRAKITFTGFGATRPSVVVRYREQNGTRGALKLDVPPVAVERPAALGAVIRDGRNGLALLNLRVKVDTEKDERDELIKRTREERVDATMMSAEQAQAIVANVGRLRAAGLYRDALAYHDLGGIQLHAAWEHDVNPKSAIVRALDPNGAPAPFPDIRRLLPAGYRHTGGPIVQWDTPIPPPEAAELLSKMSTFPEATVYKVGESYLGKHVWAMDLMPPIEASHWSQAKATTLKPTVIYSARQHANEVSSTSHVLKLAELLLTDPEFRQKLKKVNVVVHPITNADGAQLAYDLYRVTPDHMLHAGYLGSLGVDMTSAQWEDDAIYPESKIRPLLWRTWLPDIFLNPHGYPSHEWVQLFSEYAGWVRNRVTEGRDWWGMRGWFTPGFGYLDDPKHPRHKAAAFTIREMFTRNINAAPEVRALNERAYARYKRYGFAFDDTNFKLDFTNDVLVYSAIKGDRANPRAGDFMSRNPNVTIWTGSTEAPDETAYGDWMKLVATAGLQWDKAILEYLVQGQHEIERKQEAFWGGVSLSMNRPRPPKDAKDKPTTTTSSGGQ